MMYPPDLIEFWKKLVLVAMAIFAVVHAIPLLKMAWFAWGPKE